MKVSVVAEGTECLCNAADYEVSLFAGLESTQLVPGIFVSELVSARVDREEIRKGIANSLRKDPFGTTPIKEVEVSWLKCAVTARNPWSLSRPMNSRSFVEVNPMFSRNVMENRSGACASRTASKYEGTTSGFSV
jgi:hypothetical protein